MILICSFNLPFSRFLLHILEYLKIPTFQTQHDLGNHVPVNGFYRIMGVFLSSCWLFVCSCVFRVLRLAAVMFPFRVGGEDGSINCLFLQNWIDGVSNFSEMFGFSNFLGREEHETEFEERSCNEDGVSEKEQITDPIGVNELSVSTVDDDQILAAKNLSEKELLNSHWNDEILAEKYLLSDKESSTNMGGDDRIPDVKKIITFESEGSEGIDFEKDFGTTHQILDSVEPSYSFRFQFQTDKDLRQRLEESEVEDLSGWFSDTNSSDVLSYNKEESINSFEFLSEKDFIRDIVAESSVGSNSTGDLFTEKEMSDTSLDNDFLEIDLEKETENFLLDEDKFKNSCSKIFSEEEPPSILSEKDFRDSEANTGTRRELSDKETKTPMNPLIDSNKEKTEDSEKIEKTQLMNFNSIDDDDEYSESSEILWEHQDLIEQLRSELGKVRGVGLPTILEESECLKFIDDMMPWKIDEKFLKEDKMDELQKFYKSYRERMRKLDILNYQKMYAKGFFKVKDPLRNLTSHRATFPALFRLCRGRISDGEPSAKFIRELQCDLETVYVGQACLSWEILHWQYVKAKELTESDRQGTRRFDEVAGELQRFQVLLYRFLENEPFEGPTRVESYVRNRCVLENLLQVPLVREQKKAERRGGIDGVTLAMIVEILEESIRVFWNFVKADKDETIGVFKGFQDAQAELQDPILLELMADIQMSLQKKEKKLKDLVRCSNCLVKKFRKQQGSNDIDQVLFFSQIDMKLVLRVLRMSRITSDQLVWCHKKLNKIDFRGMRLHREPSFLLFPC